MTNALWRIAALCVFLCAPLGALAQDRHARGHSPEHAQLHIEHYSKWLRKDTSLVPNVKNCCGDGDCYPTAAMFDPQAGLWKAKRKEDGKWLWIPKSVYDQDDPKEPTAIDGRSHLCAVTPEAIWPAKDFVWCFRPGSAI